MANPIRQPLPTFAAHATTPTPLPADHFRLHQPHPMNNNLRTPNISVIITSEYGGLYDYNYNSWQELANNLNEYEALKNAKHFVILVSHQTTSYHRTFNTNYRGKEHAKDWIQKIMQDDMNNVLESVARILPSNEDKAKAEANA